ncbi:MAG: DUF2787 family protein [Marinomonas sp.]
MSVQTPAISFCDSVFPISIAFKNHLQHALSKHVNLLDKQYITLNFKDQSYSADRGGYHPVEIALTKMPNDQFLIQYVTDFSYDNHEDIELEKELDFDFGNSVAFTRYSGWKEIDSPGISELYQLWESNFICYLDIGAFDHVEVQGF